MKINSVALLLLLVCAVTCQGQTWVPVAGLNGRINAFAEYRTLLYAGGAFDGNGTVSLNHVAAYGGRNWGQVGSGFDGEVKALISFEDTLVAAGTFTHSGAVNTGSVARLEGGAWVPMSLGLSGTVLCFARYKNELYAGGNFTVDGGSSYGLAKWNGIRWVGIGASVDNVVDAMCPYNTSLVIGGDFTQVGGTYFNHLAQWNGTAWNSVGSGDSTGANGSVTSLVTYKGRLIVAGALDAVGNQPVSNIGSWDGTTWRRLGEGLDGVVLSLFSSSNLYAGGNFTTGSGLPLNHIARFADSTWSALSVGIEGPVSALIVWSSELYAGGDFTVTGGFDVSNFGKWSSIADRSSIVAMTYQDHDGSVSTSGDRVPKAWSIKLYKDSISSGTLLKSYQGSQMAVSLSSAGTYIVVEADSGVKWSRIGPRPYLIDTIVIALNTTYVDTFLNFVAGHAVLITIAEGWNLVSNPLLEPDKSTSVLFPGAASTLFRYGAAEGYRVSETAEPGPGYWIKYDVAFAETLNGGDIGSLSIPVTAGWNIVGAISAPVSVDSIVQQPAGIVQSKYYEYAVGYHQVTHLMPGKGYWVKVNSSGFLQLASQSGSNSQTITRYPQPGAADILEISDGTGRINTIQLTAMGLGEPDLKESGATTALTGSQPSVEFPPASPANVFEVSTATAGGSTASAPTAAILKISGAHQPVSLRWDVRSGISYRLVDHMGRSTDLAHSGSTRVTTGDGIYTLQPVRSSSNPVLPASFAMLKNYPNPFNPSTTIALELPADAVVSLVVYDQLGRETARLVSGEIMPAGRHHLVWNAGNLSSGMYFARMSAADPATGAVQYRSSQSMILIK